MDVLLVGLLAAFIVMLRHMFTHGRRGRRWGQMH
jgi:hypothetical protein